MHEAATVSTLAGAGEPGVADGPAADAQFNNPWGVAVPPDGGCFVADCDNHAVRRVAPDGAVTTVAGTGEIGGADGPGEAATFDGPEGIAVDWVGTVFVTEYFGCRVRKIARGAGGGWVVSTVVAGGLHFPRDIAVDPAGRLVVADHDHHRVVRVEPSTGMITVVAGDGTSGFRDGPGTTARFLYPYGVAVDRRGDIFVADYGNHRVRRISAADGVVTTVAGSGVEGGADGARSAAQFTFPRAIAVDGRGGLIVGDEIDEFRLRRIAASADRSVTTVAIDGAPDSIVTGSAIDRDGSLLVAAPFAHRILRVTRLGLAPPSAPAWSLRAHRGLAAPAPEVGAFVTTVMLCAMRLDTHHRDAAAAAAPRLPLEMWLAILSMLRPDQMRPRQ